MIDFFKNFIKKKSLNNVVNDTFTICSGKQYEIKKVINFQNGNIEIIVYDKHNSSTVFSKVLTDWYIDNSNFPEALLSSDEKYLVLCAYYYNPIIIIDIQSAGIYWEINKFNDIYEFSINNDHIIIKNCIDEENQKFQIWEIDIKAKIITEIQ